MGILSSILHNFAWQAHGVALGLGGTIVVAVTATLAAIGAAAIPSAGLVTMLMVLQVSFRLSDSMQSSFQTH